MMEPRHLMIIMWESLCRLCDVDACSLRYTGEKDAFRYRNRLMSRHLTM